MSGRWPQMDLREYETEIKLTDGVEILKTLRPGLTAQVEILVDNRDNVLQIPVQSVVAIGGRTFAFVLTENGPVRRDLMVGSSNQSHVEVKDGVQAGERVVLNPRTRFAPEIAVIEGEVARELGKTASEIKIPAGSTPAGGPGEGQAKPGPGGAPGGPGAPAGPGGSSGPGPNGSPGERKSPKERFTALDTNGDGQLTGDELQGPMKDRLTQIDTDGNGTISEAEFTESMARFARNRPANAAPAAPKL